MAQKSKYVVGNWKAQLTPDACASLAKELSGLKSPSDCNVWVAPPTTGFNSVISTLKGTSIKVGSQNVWPKSGAFTGETTLASLKEIGASFSLVGHSERRHVFGESIALTEDRCLGALAENFTIIFCVGETLTERESNQTNKIIENQLSGVITRATSEQKKNLIIAYEPVWAIGTGKVATIDQIAVVHAFISTMTGGSLPILYGGSVTPENFGEILNVPNVDGGLIGGASLKVESFSKLVQLAV